MPDSTQSSDGVITKPSSKSVAQTIDGLRRLMADRGFTVLSRSLRHLVHNLR